MILILNFLRDFLIEWVMMIVIGVVCLIPILPFVLIVKIAMGDGTVHDKEDE